MDQIVSCVQGHDHFVISTHISPDPDALGSALALQRALERLGKTSVVVLSDPVPLQLEFLPGAAGVLSPAALEGMAFEQVIVVDCASFKRVGDDLYERLKGHFLINLDHHVDNPRFGNLHYVRGAASCTLILDELIEALGLALDPELATCLYAGLMGDTNAFRTAEVKASVLTTAARWLEAGADHAAVTRNLFERKSWEEVQLLAYALNHLQREDGLAWCTLPLEVFSSADGRRLDTDWIVAQLRAIEGVEIAMLFKEIEPRRIKVSLRSKGQHDVNGIAQAFGGGGHLKAAGCLLEGTLEEATQAVLARVREQLAGTVRR